MNGKRTEIAEWVAKAEGDYAVALRESRVRKNPNHDDICFHCQQCIEKYLKAARVIRGGTVEKIHDLAALLRECVHDFPLWSALSRDVDLLSQYAVLFRYPGQTATKERSQRAVEAMRRCRTEIRSRLGMETGAAKKRRKRR